MLTADMVKPVRKLTPAPPAAPPKQPRSQQQQQPEAPAPKKGPVTPPPSGSALVRQQAAAARASLAGSSVGTRSGSGLARAGSFASSSGGGGAASGAPRPDPIPSRPTWLRVRSVPHVVCSCVGVLPGQWHAMHHLWVCTHIERWPSTAICCGACYPSASASPLVPSCSCLNPCPVRAHQLPSCCPYPTPAAVQVSAG